MIERSIPVAHLCRVLMTEHISKSELNLFLRFHLLCHGKVAKFVMQNYLDGHRRQTVQKMQTGKKQICKHI